MNSTKALKSQSTAEFYTYPGTTHWLFEDDRPDAYQSQTADLAWSRAIEFLKKYIR